MFIVLYALRRLRIKGKGEICIAYPAFSVDEDHRDWN
jgi:hypothetical protein